MELSNTSAIVTGGASGLGEATARALAARGVAVVVADLNDAAGEALAAEIGGAFARCDVTGANPNGDLFNLHVSPVLPRVGGFFDADLEVSFAGGTAGGVQVPMFDCTVK